MTKICLILSILTLITACGGRGTASSEELSDLKPYISQGPYTDVITGCARARTTAASCTLESLPLIAMDTAEPTIADVMDRVVVSHDWMGLRFEQLLESLPEDIMYLLGGVTAVVIDADIRPSYYWSLTGAIYIDPASLWLTLEEKDSINRKLDYRHGNESEMRLRYYTRQSINGADAARYYGLDSEIERPLEDIVIPMANLLFHELAHANDQFPRASLDQIDRSQRIADATQSLKDDYASTILVNSFPLLSELGATLGNIFYRGITPTEEQQNWTAAEVGLSFAEDGASDNYAYSTQYEDMAMLIQDTMIYLHFDIEKEIAFIEAPEQMNPPCGEALIAWGQRNRIGDPLVKERVKLVVAEILPDRDYNDRIDDIPEPTDLSGMDWCAMVDERRALNSSEEEMLSSPPPTVFLSKPWLHHQY